MLSRAASRSARSSAERASRRAAWADVTSLRAVLEIAARVVELRLQLGQLPGQPA